MNKLKAFGGVICWLLVLGLTSCTEETSTSTQPAFVADSLADSMALAHGFANWNDVERLEFTFAVDVSDTTRTERSWIWYPHTDSVVRITASDSLAFLRSEVAGEQFTKADGQFINDTYWLLMPFYAVWSETGYTASITRNSSMPLSLKPATMLTVQYNSDGGYTPGDAYDLYLDSDNRLQEWTFRKGGQAEASMTTTWAGYKELEGLYLPTDHVGDGVVRIHHPEVGVYTKH